MRQDIDRVPDCLAVNDRCGRSDRDADKRIKRHRQRKPERLSDDLIALRNGVTRKIRNVERERRPKSNHPGKRGDEEGKELSGFRLAGRKRRWLRENWTKAAGVSIRP